MNQNPYAPPQYDFGGPMPPPPTDETGFIPGGRSVAASRGFQWIADGFDLFRKSPGMWIVVCLVYGVTVGLMQQIPYIGMIAGYVLSPVFSAGLVVCARNLSRTGALELKDLFGGFKRNTSALLVVGLFNLLVFAACAGAFLLVAGMPVWNAISAPRPKLDMALAIDAARGALAFSVPMIPWGLAMFFAPAVIVLNNVSPFAAVAMSFKASLKNLGALFAFGLLSILLTVGAMIPCGLGLLMLGPTLIASLYCAYRDVFYDPFAQAEGSEISEHESRTREVEHRP